MRHVTWIAAFAALAASTAAPASAQYYPPPPRPYYAPPPRPYYPPPPRRFAGGRCNAFLPTAYGPRREICPLVRLKPIGAPCHCPAPPNYHRRWLHGRVIR